MAGATDLPCVAGSVPALAMFLPPSSLRPVGSRIPPQGDLAAIPCQTYELWGDMGDVVCMAFVVCGGGKLVIGDAGVDA